VDPGTIFNNALRNFIGAQRLPGTELQRIQSAKLRDTLRHAFENVTLYRDHYRTRGVSIDGIDRAEDLWRLPAVEKGDYLDAGPMRYIDHRQDFAALNMRPTSGSLGHALPIYANGEDGITMRACLWSAWLGQGVHPRDRLFMMAAPYLERELPPFRSAFAPASISTEETMRRFRELRPTVIIGSVECIALLAQEARRRDLPERREVRCVFPFGQTLSRQLRKMIESGFDAEIFNLYGCNEANWLGYECEKHDGLHVTTDRAIVQIARLGQPDVPAAPGELGEIIITSIIRRTTPFIRYRLKDAAALDLTPCACGRSTPRLRSLEGRVQDFLIATNGQWIGPGTVAIDLTAGQDAIIDHRVVQQTPGQVKVSIVPSPEFGPKDRQRIPDVIRRHLGEVAVEVELVEEIPREASGKRRRIYRAFEPEG
jgi:phenylacetate-CoA ligase